MDILYRSQPPAYRGCSPPPQQRTGLLAGFWCYLFGSGSAPNYRTKNGRNGSAAPAASRCWWQAFPSTPPYRAAPANDIDDSVPDVPAAPAAGAEYTGCQWREPDDLASEDVPSEVYIVTG